MRASITFLLATFLLASALYVSSAAAQTRNTLDIYLIDVEGGKSTPLTDVVAPALYFVSLWMGANFTRTQIRLHKCLTTPADPSVGALDGLTEIVAAAGLKLTDRGAQQHGQPQIGQRRGSHEPPRRDQPAP